MGSFESDYINSLEKIYFNVVICISVKDCNEWTSISTVKRNS